MKKLIAPLTLIAVAGILFSSCNNSSKLTFTKRHYRSGYFVDADGSTHTPAVVKIPAGTRYQLAPIVTAKSEAPISVNTPLLASVKLGKAVQIAATQKREEQNLAVINLSQTYLSNTILNTWDRNSVAGTSGDGSSGHANVSVPFVVIVLCAIFIPPLGVGLMYGITSYFWIDLILTLLFFFPGMIFAIIVVLM